MSKQPLHLGFTILRSVFWMKSARVAQEVYSGDFVTVHRDGTEGSFCWHLWVKKKKEGVLGVCFLTPVPTRHYQVQHMHFICISVVFVKEGIPFKSEETDLSLKTGPSFRKR